MTTLIKNGTLVTATETCQADILIEDEKIVRVSPGLQADSATLIDATGKLILPGGDCSASLEVVRDGGKPEDRKTRTAKSDTAKVSDGKPAEVSLTTTGDFFLRVSSRERRTCFESPYRLSVTTDGTTDGAKP